MALLGAMAEELKLPAGVALRRNDRANCHDNIASMSKVFKCELRLRVQLAKFGHTFKPLRNATEDPRPCESCGDTARRMPKCSGCKWAHYCNQACQTADWQAHKRKCDPDCMLQSRIVGIPYEIVATSTSTCDVSDTSLVLGNL